MFNSISKDQNERLKALDDAIAVIEFATDGTVLFANRNFLEAMGYQLDEIKGKKHAIFVDPAYAQSQDYQLFWQNLRQGHAQQAEYKRLSKDGHAVWIEATYKPSINARGEVTKIIKFATVITERKNLALDYASQINAIDRSQAVIEFTLDGTIVKANQNFLTTVGYSKEEIIGKNHSMFVDTETRNSQDYKRFWDKLRQGEFFSAEYKRLGKNGKEIWLQATYSPIFDTNGNTYKVVKYASDISSHVESLHRKEKLVKIIDQNIKEVNQAISSANRQTSSAAGATTQTSANVQAVASAAEEMNASVDEIAQNMNRSRGAVDGMITQVQSADLATQRLVTTAQSMSGIVSLIQDIAGQINLLALNATIESARAGEAGKGFAVVASEVKNLAGQTAKATEQIAREIEGIQTVSREAVESLGTIRLSIENVREYVTNVAGAIEEQSAVMREISSNMQVASQGVNSVNESMGEIAQSTQMADIAAQKVQEASVALGLAA